MKAALATPVHGHVDGEGRLASADAKLAELHTRAGGVPGGALAVPQHPTRVRRVRRNRIQV